MRQLYIRFIYLTILVIFSFQSNSRYFSSISPFSVISDKTELDHSSKEKNHKIKRKVLSVKNEDKNRYINTLSTLPLKTISTKPLGTQLGAPLGPDPFMFTIVSSKESVTIGEEFELTVRVSWLDFGINNGVRFQPEWYKYTLKVVMPDGFVQTGGNYEDYCTAPVNAENPTATFTIKGHFEFEPKEPTFKVLRGFEGFNDKSEFIWKGDKSIEIGKNINTSSRISSECSNNGVNENYSSGVNKNSYWLFPEGTIYPELISITVDDNFYTINYKIVNNTCDYKLVTDAVRNTTPLVYINNGIGWQTSSTLTSQYYGTAITDSVGPGKSSQHYSMRVPITFLCSSNSVILGLVFKPLKKNPTSGLFENNSFPSGIECGLGGKRIDLPSVFYQEIIATATQKSSSASASLSATGCGSGTLKWYKIDNLSLAIGTGSKINVDPSSTTKYKAQCIINDCGSKWSNEIEICNIPIPILSGAKTIISGATATIQADGCQNGVITWDNSITSTDKIISISPTSTTIYKARCSMGNCKSDWSEGVKIIVESSCSTPAPIVSGTTTIDKGKGADLLASGCIDGIINWYESSNINNRLSSELTYTVYPLATTNYIASCSKNGCVNWSENVTITVRQSCDVTKPVIVTDRKTVNNQYPTTQLTATNCAYTVIWYNNNGIEQKTGFTYNVGEGTYYAKCVNTCANGIKGEINSDNIIITNNEAPCSSSNYWPTITNNSTGQVGDKTFCSNGVVSLSVSGCYDNSKAIWYDTYGNFLANGSTYSSTINSNQTFAVSCENQCNPTQRLGWETINFTVIPYDQCVSFNPQIVNKTPGNVTTFCGNGQFSVLASGCPDGNRVKWWVGDGSTVQGSEYVANITTTTWVSFRCISPVTGDLIGPEKYLIFTVKSFSDCNYAPAIINNTPGKKTVFCTKGWIDLTVTGCPNNNLARWYTDGTELTGGIGSTLRGSITRTSRIGVTCLNPNDNTDFGWNEITFKVDNSGCDANNPTIINNTTHAYNKFCKKGWVSLEVDGCPDNNKAKWYKNNIFVKQSAIYNEVITQNATYKVTCENPAYESSYSEMTFEVLTNGDCYIPSVVNLTPNGQTDFCGSGILKLMISGCNTNYPPAFEEHIDGKPVRSFGGTWEMIDGVNTSVLNYNATESGYIKVICRTNESQNDYIWASQQIVKFKVNPVPIISASNTAACVGTPFSLSAIVPNIPINRGDIKFEWTNANNIAIGSQQNISLLAANSTPTTYSVKFTNNKGCSATASTIVTNYALPVVTVANSSITQCAGTVINLNASSTAGSGKATIQVKLEENITNTDRSIMLSITGTMNPTPTSVTITQKGKTNSTCITCLNNNITDGQIIGYRDINQPNQKAIIKIENGCAKAWWYDLNEAVHTDWIPFLKNKLYPDSIIRSCISFDNLNNCSNNKACNQGSNSDITNFTSAGGITSFEINLPSVSGTWSVSKPTGSDKNWLSFVNAPSGATTFTGGDALNYNWTKGTTFKSTLQNPSIGNIQVSDAGTYKVEVTDVRNCVGSATVNVVVNPLPDPTVSAASTTTFCQGGSVILSAVAGMTNYQWKKDGVNIAGATSQTYTATTSGAYTVQVTNSNNCSSTSTIANGKTVTVNPTPPTPVATGATICYGNSTTLSATGCTGSVGTYTLSWFKVTGNTPVTMPVNPTVNTDYYTKCVQTENGISCESLKSANITVVVNTPPSITTQPASTSICSGQNTSFTINATGTGLIYQWQLNNGSGFTNIVGQTTSSLTISNATVSMSSYKYRCLVSGSCTPTATSNEAVLTVNANPTVTANATNLNVSAGQSVTLQASGASSYTWTGPDGFTSSAQNPIVSNFSAAKAGIYTVTGLSGTCTTKANVTIALNTCAVSAATLINVCAGQTTAFTASGGDTYEWQGPSNGKPFNERVANPKIYNTGKADEGKYTVTISKTGANACSAKYDVQLNVSDLYGFSPTIEDNTNRSNCISQLTLIAKGCPAGTTYKWYDISPENAEANRSQPILVTTTTNQLVSSINWNYPMIKVECVTNTITSCPPPSHSLSVTTIRKPTISIKNIIQPCEYELSTEAVPIGKVTFEIKNASPLTAYALARSDEGIPSSWDDAFTRFQGIKPGTKEYITNMGYPFRKNEIKVIQQRPETELPPKHIDVSETVFNIKNANIPSSGSVLWRLILLDNLTKCITATEEFEVYKPNKSIIANPVSQDNVVNCFNDLGSAVINLQSINFVTGNIFEGNKQLFTKIVNNAIQVLDDNDNVIKNVTKTSGVGTDVNRGYKINLTGLPASTTIKAYQDACVGPQANAITCEKLPRYRVSFVAGDGCTYNSPRFVVQQPDVLELYAGANDPNCYGEKIPSVELIANGGNSGKQFYLVTGTTETKIGDADANGKYIVQASQYGATPPYTFKVKDSKSCNVSKDVTKSPLLQFVATAVVSTETPEVATMTFTGGKKPFYYAIVPATQSANPTTTQWLSISANSGYVDGDPIDSKAMAPGKYKVYMKYGACETLTSPINITIGTKTVPEPPITPISAICASSVEQIKDQVKCNQPFCDVKWYANATGGDTLRLQEDIVNSMTNIGKKEFYVSTKIQGTDKETSARVKVSLLFIPNATVSAPNLTICEGSAISLANLATINNPTTNALTGVMALQVTNPENKVFDDSNFFPDKSGVYKIKQLYKDNPQSLGCSSSGKDLTLTIIPAPSTPLLAQKEFTFCTDMVATAITPTKSNTSNGLLWIDPNKTIADSYNPITSAVGIKTLQVYELAYKSTTSLTEANACRSLLPLTITLNTVTAANLPVPTIKVGGAVCGTNKVSLEATGCSSYMTVNWLANTASGGAYQSVGTGLTYAASAGITYKANCVVKAGSCEGPSSTELAVNTTMTAFNVKITANTPLAEYQTLDLKALASPNATYAWTGPNNFTSTLQNPRIVDLTSAAAGTYTVTATESTCTATSTIVIAVNQVADCNIKIKAMSGTTETYKFPSTRSASSSALTLSVVDNVSPAYWNVSPTTYSWKDPEGIISTESTLTATKKGEYTLQITKDGKQCESSVTLNGTPCGDVLDYICNPNDIAAPPAGVTPLKVLRQGDEIFAGDFKGRVISSSGNDTFSGTIGVKVPYLFGAEVLATFTNIQLNDCYELQSGADNKLITVYNPAAGGILDIDEIANDIGSLINKGLEILSKNPSDPINKANADMFFKEMDEKIALLPVSQSDYDLITGKLSEAKDAYGDYAVCTKEEAISNPGGRVAACTNNAPQKLSEIPKCRKYEIACVSESNISTYFPINKTFINCVTKLPYTLVGNIKKLVFNTATNVNFPKGSLYAFVAENGKLYVINSLGNYSIYTTGGKDYNPNNSNLLTQVAQSVTKNDNCQFSINGVIKFSQSDCSCDIFDCDKNVDGTPKDSNLENVIVDNYLSTPLDATTKANLAKLFGSKNNIRDRVAGDRHNANVKLVLTDEQTAADKKEGILKYIKDHPKALILWLEKKNGSWIVNDNSNVSPTSNSELENLGRFTDSKKYSVKSICDDIAVVLKALPIDVICSGIYEGLDWVSQGISKAKIPEYVWNCNSSEYKPYYTDVYKVITAPAAPAKFLIGSARKELINKLTNDDSKQIEISNFIKSIPTIDQLEFVLLCGIWNGLVDIPVGLVSAIGTIADAGTAEGINGFSSTFEKLKKYQRIDLSGANPVIYSGLGWALWDAASEEFNGGCKIAHFIGNLVPPIAITILTSGTATATLAGPIGRFTNTTIKLLNRIDDLTDKISLLNYGFKFVGKGASATMGFFKNGDVPFFDIIDDVNGTKISGKTTNGTDVLIDKTETTGNLSINETNNTVTVTTKNNQSYTFGAKVLTKLDNLINLITHAPTKNWLIKIKNNNKLNFSGQTQITYNGKKAFEIENGVLKAQEASSYKKVLEFDPEAQAKLNGRATPDEGIAIVEKEDGTIACVGGLCFPAGTIVKVKTNNKLANKVIENIVAGDTVASYNHNKKQFTWGLVKATKQSVKNKLVNLYVAGVIICQPTFGHRIWELNHQDYVPAQELKSGDKFLNAKGLEIKLDSISVSDTIIKVYNFEVEEYHNYLVGEEGILVHNDCAFEKILKQKGLNDLDIARFKKNFEDLKKQQGFTSLSASKFNEQLGSLSVSDATKFLDDFDKLSKQINCKECQKAQKFMMEHPSSVEAWKGVNVMTDVTKRDNYLKMFGEMNSSRSSFTFEFVSTNPKHIRVIDGKNPNNEWAKLYENKIDAIAGITTGNWNPVLNVVPLVAKLNYTVTTINGGKVIYGTDVQGRVNSISMDNIQKAPANGGSPRNNTEQTKNCFEKKNGKYANLPKTKADDGGHLIAAQFYGPGEQINYLPIEGTSNQNGDWSKFEKAISDEIAIKKEGAKINVRIAPVYSAGGTSGRPIRFIVEADSDGVPLKLPRPDIDNP